MRVKVLKACLVRGQYVAAGQTAEVEEKDGVSLIENGRAVMIPEDRVREPKRKVRRKKKT